ncbi:hypothetical protein LTR08_000847 [Meristemomyces frigidus]|nr:hypothetical protein LTR08_000847 [Meristemomyces frigidus]
MRQSSPAELTGSVRPKSNVFADQAVLDGHVKRYRELIMTVGDEEAKGRVWNDLHNYGCRLESLEYYDDFTSEDWEEQVREEICRDHAWLRGEGAEMLGEVIDAEAARLKAAVERVRGGV